MLRCFEDENITHVDGTIDPIRDKEIIDTELQLKDLETIESRLAKTEKAAAAGNKDAKIEVTVLKAYKEVLEQGKNARIVEFETKDEQDCARNLFLLTSKPVLYVCNVGETDAKSGNDFTKRVGELAQEEGAEMMIIAAKTEEDIAELESYEDKQMFLEELGLEESGVNRLIKKAYALVLVSFTPTSKRALSAPRSSSTTTISSMALRRPSAKQANWPSRVRTTSSRTAISCTSDSTFDFNYQES